MILYVVRKGDFLFILCTVITLYYIMCNPLHVGVYTVTQIPCMTAASVESKLDIAMIKIDYVFFPQKNSPLWKELAG